MSSKKTGMEKGGDKCRKSPKVKQSKTPPKYSDAIQTAIISLKEKGGSSEKAILKFICANFNVGDEKAASKHVKLALKAAIKDGTLKQSPDNISHRLYCLGNANRKLPKSVISKPITKQGSSKPSEKTAKKHNKNQAKNEVVRGAVKKSKQSKASLKGKQSKQTIKKPSKAFMKGKQSEQTIKKPSKASMKGKQPKQSIKKPSKAYVKGKQSKQSMVGSPKTAKVTNTSKVKKRKRPNEKTVARQR